MPNTKSAERRTRSNARKQQRNASTKSRVKTLERTYVKALTAGDKDLAAATFKTYTSAVDKAVKKGAIHQSTASRKKSRLSTRLVAAK